MVRVAHSLCATREFGSRKASDLCVLAHWYASTRASDPGKVNLGRRPKAHTHRRPTASPIVCKNSGRFAASANVVGTRFASAWKNNWCCEAARCPCASRKLVVLGSRRDLVGSLCLAPFVGAANCAQRKEVAHYVRNPTLRKINSSSPRCSPSARTPVANDPARASRYGLVTCRCF